MPTHDCAVKRARLDRQELAAINGVTIAASDDPLTINLYFNPSRVSDENTSPTLQRAFHFRINIPTKYPFHPPSFKWISRPSGPAGHTPFLGPNGDVSVSALSQWTPASSLSNVLICLFPSETLAAQCRSVTSHIWLMGESREATSRAFTDPQVLHCLAEYMLQKEPASSYALHQTCRAAASAVQQAVSNLSVVSQHVDIVHAVHTFSALSHLTCTQCALTFQSIFQVDPSSRLMSSLRSVAVIRCSVKQMFGDQGLFAALKTLPHLEEFTFEPATSMLWALYNNVGQTEFAANPFGEDNVLTLPAHVPRPVPPAWSSIWVGLASVTQLKTLKVTAPLCDMAFAPRDASRHGWSAAARIVDHAFSSSCLSSMPCLKNLSMDLQHVNVRTQRPGEGAPPAEHGPVEHDDFCAWELPTCKLQSFSLSGIALGERQLNYHHVSKDFWGSLEELHIGHTAVSDDLQATALKLLVYLAKNVRSLDVASLEELLSKLAMNPMSPVSYMTLLKLQSLSTTLVGKLADVPHLTHLELRSCKSYVNLNLVAESLPHLRVLEGLPFKRGTDHRFYWPLRQCSKLEKLVTLPGPPGAASSIQSVIGSGVQVNVPVWAEESARSQAVFHRGFFPAHRPMLSAYDPSDPSDADAFVGPVSPAADADEAAYQGYALGRMRSRSQGPPFVGDSPRRQSGDPGAAPEAGHSASPHAPVHVPQPVDQFRMAMPARRGIGAAAVGLPDAPHAVPTLPHTPVAVGPPQPDDEMDDNALFASGDSTADTLQDRGAAMRAAGSAVHAPAPQGFMAGVASWGAGLGRFLSSQLGAHPSALHTSSKPLPGSHALGSRGTVGVRQPPWEAAASRQAHVYDPRGADNESMQSFWLRSQGTRPDRLLLTSCPSGLGDGRRGQEPDMDSPTQLLDVSEDDSHLCSGIDDHMRRSTWQVESYAWTSVDSSTAGQGMYHMVDDSLTAPCGTDNLTAHALQSSRRSVHASRRQGAGAQHGRAAAPNSSMPTAVGGDHHIHGSSSHTAPHANQVSDPAELHHASLSAGLSANAGGTEWRLNAMLSGTIHNGRTPFALHHRTSSEGGRERTHKRHASERSALQGCACPSAGIPPASPDPDVPTVQKLPSPYYELQRQVAPSDGGRSHCVQEPSAGAVDVSTLEHTHADADEVEAPRFRWMQAHRQRQNPERACQHGHGEHAEPSATHLLARCCKSPFLSPSSSEASGPGPSVGALVHASTDDHMHMLRDADHVLSHLDASPERSHPLQPFQLNAEAERQRRGLGYNPDGGGRPHADDGSDSDSGQLSAERRRLSTLAIRRSVHRDIRRRAAARETLRQTLGSGVQQMRSLLAFGAESTPRGISVTPRTTEPPASTLLACCTRKVCEPGISGAFATSEDYWADEDTRTLRILELPLCPQGHRPSLVAQINAQASPQFEQLGPYLFRIGCCKTCRLQIPSLVDLTVDDVSGTCTDTILVVSPELSQAVTQSTMQASKRPRTAMQGPEVLAGSQQFHVQQVHKHDVMGMDQLETVHLQQSHIAWISCWVPTEPALESPTRNDVQALARAHSTEPPPMSEHPHGRAAARLGGTRATASPACRLCCNRMRLVVTLPCSGSVVCEAQRCSDILQTFKCHLHPQEIQCSWTSVAVESGRSSSEA